MERTEDQSLVVDQEFNCRPVKMFPLIKYLCFFYFLPPVDFFSGRSNYRCNKSDIYIESHYFYLYILKTCNFVRVCNFYIHLNDLWVLLCSSFPCFTVDLVFWFSMYVVFFCFNVNLSFQICLFHALQSFPYLSLFIFFVFLFSFVSCQCFLPWFSYLFLHLYHVIHHPPK